jgi:hypothetical protein
MGDISQINKLLQPYHVEVHLSKESLDPAKEFTQILP